MHKQRFTTRQLVRAALIAAVYAALCWLLAPISYGAIQIRVSEALTLLPVLCPEAAIGVTLGCLLANMLGGMPIDMVLGTLATLLAALATRRLRGVRTRRGIPAAASLPPVVFNALIIGAEITWLEASAFPLPLLLFNMLMVGAGQVVSCCGLGLLLVWAIERNPRLKSLFADAPGEARRTVK